MELTPEQKAAFPAFLARWTASGLSTNPADRPAAERGVALAYKAAGLEPPQRYFWLGSPLAGALVDTMISSLSAAGETPRSNSKSETKYSARILAVVDSCIPVLEAVCVKDGKPIKITRKAVIESLSRLQLHNAAYGQHDASILCFYDFFAQACGVEECSKLAGLNLVAQSCSWWWAYDTIAVLTERPSHLALDARGRLHSDSGWAVHYPDGFGYTLVHGVEVPEHVVLNPAQITIAEIEAETNIEIRRVMIDKYGQSRFLLDSGATEIHKDDWGTLYHKDIPEDEPIRMVKVINSTPEPDGHSKDYFIRVNPACQTALEAVAWTFNKTPEEYKHLLVQT